MFYSCQHTRNKKAYVYDKVIGDYQHNHNCLLHLGQEGREKTVQYVLGVGPDYEAIIRESMRVFWKLRHVDDGREHGWSLLCEHMGACMHVGMSLFCQVSL